jgi:hypothetical protein
MRPRDTSDERDDVDLLFARLHSVTPPADLTARILRSLPAELPVQAFAPPMRSARPANSGSNIPWRWIALGAGVVLAIMSLRLGGLLDDSGASSVFAQIFSDFGGFLASPSDYLSPLMGELPWFDIIISLTALVTFWVSSSASVDQARGNRPNGRF